MHEFLEERPADALGRTAAHLAFDEGWIERTSDVLRDRMAEELDLAGVPVDPDMREVGRHRRGTFRLCRAAVALDRLVAAAEAERLPGDLRNRDRTIGRADRAHDSVDYLEVGGCDLELLRRRRQELLARGFGRP